MGDKSPKSKNKLSGQKQSKAASHKQQQKQAAADKQSGFKKK